MARSLVQEKPHHTQAFELYYGLGAKRAYRAVAEHFGVSPSSVKAWARQGQWQERLQEREAEIARQSTAKTIETAVTDLAQLKKITRLGLMRVAKSLANGHDISKQIADLDRIVRLITYLDGGPKGPDPTSAEDVRAFLDQVPDHVLREIAGKARGGDTPGRTR
jgi:transposase-like protein